ncbi:MAG: hypothetical protein AABZ60_03675 [Planctomycetota bacterium]
MGKCFSILFLFLFIAPIVIAQEADFAPTIKGTLDITYNTRSDLDEAGNPKEGVRDMYFYDLVVFDTLLFQGGICNQPTLFSSVLGREIQSAFLHGDMVVSARNPSNVSEVKVIGKITGSAPINKKGVYSFSDGNLRMAIDAAGQAEAFESLFRGSAEGTASLNDNTLARTKKEAIALTKNIREKKIKILVRDYELMKFTDLVLASGPAKVYPETTVNGEFMYDFERNVWFFRNIKMSYNLDGKEVTDVLTGHIKWVEDTQRNGEGQYEYDVRINEPEQSTTLVTVFEEIDDEAAFFAVDNTLTALVGTVIYKDIIKHEVIQASVKNEVVQSSKVVIDLTGNKLSKVQVLNLTKLLMFVGVVPMNSD